MAVARLSSARAAGLQVVDSCTAPSLSLLFRPSSSGFSPPPPPTPRRRRVEGNHRPTHTMTLSPDYYWGNTGILNRKAFWQREWCKHSIAKSAIGHKHHKVTGISVIEMHRTKWKCKVLKLTRTIITILNQISGRRNLFCCENNTVIEQFLIKPGLLFRFRSRLSDCKSRLENSALYDLAWHLNLLLSSKHLSHAFLCISWECRFLFVCFLLFLLFFLSFFFFFFFFCFRYRDRDKSDGFCLDVKRDLLAFSDDVCWSWMLL